MIAKVPPMEERDWTDVVAKAVAIPLVILAAVVVGVVMVYLVILLVSEDVTANVKASILALFGVVAVAMLTHTLTQRREIRARRFAQRQEVYAQMLDAVLERFRPQADQSTTLDDALFRQKVRAAMWGDHDLVAWWRRLNEIDARKLSDGEVLAILDELLRLVREELGTDNDEIEEGDLIAMFSPHGRDALP